ASQHLLGTILVAVDGETATSSTYFQAQHVKVGTPGGDHLIIAGTYRDRWSYENGRWQIAERVQTYSWRDGNPEVTRRDRPPTEAS
ncbi:MAG: nuclear transport factor 2 family protein, partial [Acidimicrobiales bacterium]